MQAQSVMHIVKLRDIATHACKSNILVNYLCYPLILLLMQKGG